MFFSYLLLFRTFGSNIEIVDFFICSNSDIIITICGQSVAACCHVGIGKSVGRLGLLRQADQVDEFV